MDDVGERWAAERIEAIRADRAERAVESLETIAFVLRFFWTVFVTWCHLYLLWCARDWILAGLRRLGAEGV